jgi:flagella basal body P-ring formation protein FlgA
VARELLDIQSMRISTSKFRRLACIALLAAGGAAAQDYQAPDRIMEAARAEAQKRLPTLAGNQRLLAGPVDGRLRLANCPQALDARIATGAGPTDRAMVEVRCTAGTGWRVFVPVRIAGTHKAVVLKRSVVLGETLKPEDLSVIEADPAQLPLGYFDDPQVVAGLTMSRSMAAGLVLSNQSLKLPTAIVRGQQVTLLAGGEGLNVRMAGRAMSDGYINQRIKVQNNSSGKVLEGIARSDHLVEINSQ